MWSGFKSRARRAPRAADGTATPPPPEPAAGDGGRVRLTTPGLWMRLGVLGVIIGSYIATITINVANERELVLSEVRRLSAVTTTSAKTHTEAVFEATVQLLAALRSDLSRSSVDERSEQALLDDHFFDPSYLRATLILDRRGHMTANTVREFVGNDASYFRFFQIHETAADDLVYTGDIIIGNVTRAPHFFSSLGRRDRNGSFAGVVAAAYELTYFRDIYSQLVPGPDYAIALFHAEEGLVVASDSEIRRGELPSSSQFPSNVPRDISAAPTSFRILLEDGRSAFTHTLPVGDGPFFVSTMADLDKLLGQHDQASLIKYALATLFVLTAVGFAIALELFLYNRRRAEADKAALETRLRHSQKMEALGTLAGGLAHDFNNLLSSIIGFGELARDRADDPPKRRHAIEQVLRAGHRAERMVDQILTFSRRADPEREPVPVDRVVEEVVELLRVSIPPNLKISLHTQAAPLWTMGNPTQLDQVFMNLCTNAIDAMPQGGQLEITIDSLELDAAEAGQNPGLAAGSYVRVRVRDGGTGIPPEIRDRIFDPFFTTKDTGRGTGLGLAIAHGIVAAHGGSIDASRADGGGTCVTVCLPQCDSSAIAAAETSDAAAIDGEGRRVMIVDDEEAIVELAEERLALMGFEPVGFSSAREALEAFEKQSAEFDLVVTDYAMPEMDGLSLARAVWSHRPDIPVLLISGFATAESLAQADALGIRDFISKPLTAEKLAAPLARILRAERYRRTR